MPGNYLTLRRNWRANDTIEIRMPFHFYLDPVMDQPNVASIFYGPVLLAAQESAPGTIGVRSRWMPATSRSPSRAIPARSRFTIDGVPFKPFYESYERYSVYLHVSSK